MCVCIYIYIYIFFFVLKILCFVFFCFCCWLFSLSCLCHRPASHYLQQMMHMRPVIYTGCSLRKPPAVVRSIYFSSVAEGSTSWRPPFLVANLVSQQYLVDLASRAGQTNSGVHETRQQSWQTHESENNQPQKKKRKLHGGHYVLCLRPEFRLT